MYVTVISVYRSYEFTVLTTRRKCVHKNIKVSEPTKTAPIFEPLVTNFELDCYVLHGVPQGSMCQQISANYHKVKTKRVLTIQSS